MAENIITTQDLTVFYGKHRGINGVVLNVEEGEVFGFLGPKGAGKTTTQWALRDLARHHQSVPLLQRFGELFHGRHFIGGSASADSPYTGVFRVSVD